MVRLDSISFGLSDDVVIDYINREFNDPKRDIYIAKRENEIVGKILIDRSEGSAFFYGFAVFPEYRGKGYGREILGRMVQQMLAEGRTLVQLEVAVDNERALQLYESCGFRITSSYGYYELFV